MSDISLAIVGTAGRGDDGYLLAKDPYHYLTMMHWAAQKVIELTGARTLVSGAAAWADHQAIILFLRDQVDDGCEDCLKLRLELPVPMQKLGSQYRFVEERGGLMDTGTTSNRYHDKFTNAARGCFKEGWSSFDDLYQAINHPNCEVNHGGGFKARNLKVATATHLLAMTFGNGKECREGGTSHTLNEFLTQQGGPCRPEREPGIAYHLDLNTGKLYKGATVNEDALQPFKPRAQVGRELLDKFDARMPF